MVADDDDRWQGKPLLDATLDDLTTEPGSTWRRVDVVAETGSTNADLIGRAAAGEDISGVVLIAENQTAGRGRNGRSWSATPGAQILMSIGVSATDVPAASWGWLPLAAGVAVIDAVTDVALGAGNVPVGLKWPNDVLAGADGSAGKLAGILAEVARPASTIVVGLGLNVTMRLEDLPSLGTATSLRLLGVEAPDRALLVRALLRELGQRIEGWRRAGGADEQLQADYRSHSLTIGTRVRALLPGDQKIEGTARSIDDQGRLVVDTPDKEIRISAGDIVHLRPVHVSAPGPPLSTARGTEARTVRCRRIGEDRAWPTAGCWCSGTRCKSCGSDATGTRVGPAPPRPRVPRCRSSGRRRAHGC